MVLYDQFQFYVSHYCVDFTAIPFCRKLFFPVFVRVVKWLLDTQLYVSLVTVYIQVFTTILIYRGIILFFNPDSYQCFQIAVRQ